MTTLRVQDLGEQGLLQKLQAFCPAEVVGDDAAVLALDVGQSLVVTTDMLIENVHFSQQTTSAEDVGWRAAAANLSDLAAMGATPLGITVALSLPGSLPVDWLISLYKGLSACLQPWQSPILGGDCCRSATTAIAITALGQVSPHRVIKRSTAQPGDLILASGVHGASRAGLELLLKSKPSVSPLPEHQRAWIVAHQRPRPRLDLLSAFQSLANPFRLAGMDSSDGLADAVLQICRASGVGAQLFRSQLPLPSGLVDWVGLKTAIAWALYGGEDFELILCCPRAIAADFIKHWHCQAIGQITEQTGVFLGDPGEGQEELFLEQGFQHF